jgi:hypothetical protein
LLFRAVSYRQGGRFRFSSHRPYRIEEGPFKTAHDILPPSPPMYDQQVSQSGPNPSCLTTQYQCFSAPLTGVKNAESMITMTIVLAPGADICRVARDLQNRAAQADVIADFRLLRATPFQRVVWAELIAFAWIWREISQLIRLSFPFF